VPIVNENDTVAVEELKFGDNDNLSALTAALVEADLLVMLTDVEGLYTHDPRLDASATLVRVAHAGDAAVQQAAGPSQSGVGTGGMASKLAAARKAAAAGIPTIIADGTHTDVLSGIFDPTVERGTLLLAGSESLGRRKHWIATRSSLAACSSWTRARSRHSARAGGACCRRACAG
jgi:glutamate 5-kinase